MVSTQTGTLLPFVRLDNWVRAACCLLKEEAWGRAFSPFLTGLGYRVDLLVRLVTWS